MNFVSLEEFLRQDIQAEAAKIHMECARKGDPQFLDAVLDVMGDRIYEFQIIHRMPDNKFPNGKIFLTAFDSSCDMILGKESFGLLAEDLGRIISTNKIEWYDGYTFDPAKSFNASKVTEWMLEYKRLDYVKAVSCMAR